MNLHKKVSTSTGFIIITISAIVFLGGAFTYQYFVLQEIRKMNNAESINLASNFETYTNSEYGFKIDLPASWQGYSIMEGNWEGRALDTGDQKYSGVEILIKNLKTTPQQAWQDIPIMVFTHDIWNLVAEEKIAVSAAPIGPAKIGENIKYVFATPPRWYGFTDAIGWQDAVEAVKTFKAF